MVLLRFNSCGVLFLFILFWWTFLCCFAPSPLTALTTDGLSLLAFKFAISADPTQSLSSWVESDDTPCSWTGVACRLGRVTALSLPNCSLGGYLPSELGLLSSLLTLELPRNNLSGPIPTQIRTLVSLTSLDLSHNALAGPIPTEVGALENLAKLDLSDNRLNGSLPPSIASLPRLSGVLNLSFNALSGRIPAAFGSLPVAVSLDLRGNNLSGEIPQTGTLLNQGPTAFAGNLGLCGFPLKEACSIPDESPRVPLPNGQKPDPDGDLSFPSPRPAEPADLPPRKRVRSVTVPVLSGVLAVALVTILVLQWQFRKNHKSAEGKAGKDGTREDEEKRGDIGHGGGGEIFVAVDEGFVLELEELLRASAYVVGKSRSGIVYKVVVGRGGAAVAVRRLSEVEDGSGSNPVDGGGGAWKRRRDFESEAMAIGRVKHPNVASLRAYYYAPDEKLLVYDYIPNGSLHCALHGGVGGGGVVCGGSSATSNSASLPPPLPWAGRLKIAQGAARGLAYLHECSPRKHVHGNLKSSKILLDEDLHPYISGFGLARLTGAATANANNKSSAASHHSRKLSSSTTISLGTTKAPNSSSSTAYIPPEVRAGGGAMTQKGDVYAFGVVLLEILTGRLPGRVAEVDGVELEGFIRAAFREERPMSEIVDPQLLHEVYAKKQVLAVFHVALGCTEADPELRPRMRAVSESLDRVGGPQ